MNHVQDRLKWLAAIIRERVTRNGGQSPQSHLALAAAMDEVASSALQAGDAFVCDKITVRSAEILKRVEADRNWIMSPEYQIELAKFFERLMHLCIDQQNTARSA